MGFYVNRKGGLDCWTCSVPVLLKTSQNFVVKGQKKQTRNNYAHEHFETIFSS